MFSACLILVLASLSTGTLVCSQNRFCFHLTCPSNYPANFRIKNSVPSPPSSFSLSSVPLTL